MGLFDGVPHGLFLTRVWHGEYGEGESDCGREDSNLHALFKGTSTSSWGVYHFATSAWF
jgi:hypothetical protein